MPQPTKGPRLGGSPEHQKLMLANLATSLFTHGRIHTTRAKADRLRPYAERLITKAKKGDLHNRRIIQEQIRDKDVVHRLLAEIGPFFADRPGGYTRIVKTLPRKGDNAPMAIIELVNERTASAEASQATRVASSQESQSSESQSSESQSSESQSSEPQPGDAATGAAATAATIAAAESGEETSSPEVPEAEAAASEETDTASEATASEQAASEGTASEGTDDVPEDMADNAAASAGLDTDSDDKSDESKS